MSESSESSTFYILTLKFYFLAKLLQIITVKVAIYLKFKMKLWNILEPV